MSPLPAKARRKSAPKAPEVVETAELPRAAKKPGRRAVGRPTGEGGDLRARLLDVAVTCFAHHGIAASTLRQIAQQAGVNPALVHYYFGDKQQLLQAVISERLMPAFTDGRDATLRGGDDIAGVIAGFVRGMCEAVEKHPWLPPLWVREVLCEGGALRELLFTTMAPQMPQILAAKFAQAQADGQLNRELDPRLLVTSLIGLTLFPAAGAPIWRRLFDADDIDAVAMKNHAIALLDSGIGAP